jgi:hypothetical protein
MEADQAPAPVPQAPVFGPYTQAHHDAATKIQAARRGYVVRRVIARKYGRAMKPRFRSGPLPIYPTRETVDRYRRFITTSGLGGYHKSKHPKTSARYRAWWESFKNFNTARHRNNLRILLADGRHPTYSGSDNRIPLTEYGVRVRGGDGVMYFNHPRLQDIGYYQEGLTPRNFDTKTDPAILHRRIKSTFGARDNDGIRKAHADTQLALLRDNWQSPFGIVAEREGNFPSSLHPAPHRWRSRYEPYRFERNPLMRVGHYDKLRPIRRTPFVPVQDTSVYRALLKSSNHDVFPNYVKSYVRQRMAKERAATKLQAAWRAKVAHHRYLVKQRSRQPSTPYAYIPPVTFPEVSPQVPRNLFPPVVTGAQQLEAHYMNVSDAVLKKEYSDVYALYSNPRTTLAEKETASKLLKLMMKVWRIRYPKKATGQQSLASRKAAAKQARTDAKRAAAYNAVANRFGSEVRNIVRAHVGTAVTPTPRKRRISASAPVPKPFYSRRPYIRRSMRYAIPYQNYSYGYTRKRKRVKY